MSKVKSKFSAVEGKGTRVNLGWDSSRGSYHSTTVYHSSYGEGYTDSSHEIIESSDVNDVHDYCISRAKECISIDDGEITETINKGESCGSVSYQIDADYGCIHWRYLSEDDIFSP